MIQGCGFAAGPRASLGFGGSNVGYKELGVFLLPEAAGLKDEDRNDYR